MKNVQELGWSISRKIFVPGNGNFPKSVREFPGIPGNFKTHFIKTQKHPNSEKNAIH